MPLVKLYGNLRQHVETYQLELPGGSVREVLSALCTGRELLRDAIFVKESLQPHIRVVLNGHDIELLQGLDTPVERQDELAIFPPIAGG